MDSPTNTVAHFPHTHPELIVYYQASTPAHFSILVTLAKIKLIVIGAVAAPHQVCRDCHHLDGIDVPRSLLGDSLVFLGQILK